MSGGIAELRAWCSRLGISVDEAIDEKIEELRFRLLTLCVPNDRLKDSQIEHYLEEILGRSPEAYWVAHVRRQKRGARAPEAVVINLEKKQLGRCATCGRFLTAASLHVDHIDPLAFGGVHAESNYQLLCALCNSGKGAILSWIMAAPFFAGPGDRLTPRLRYCALARARSRCSAAECGETARTSEIVVTTRVTVARGGRWIFDNLITLCAEHAEEREEEERTRVFARTLATKYGVPTFRR